MTDTTFDPGTVPPFPVITLELREDDTVIVNGAPAPIGMDESPHEAGLKAAGQVIASLGLDAARVRAVSPDGEHYLVVTTDGTAYDAPAPQTVKDTAAAGGNSRGRALGIGIFALMAAILVVVAVFAVRTISAQLKPVPVASGPAHPQGWHANAPILAPPGYSQVANWALKVDESYTPTVIPGNRLAIVTDQGDFELVNTKNGKVTWQGAGKPDGQNGIHYTHIGTRPALASGENGQLTLWALDLDTGGKSRATTIQTSSQAKISYIGSAPLIDLGDQTVDIVTAAKVVQRDVPVTAHAILATDQGTVIAADERNYYTIGTTGQPVSKPLPKPNEAVSVVGDPEYVTATDDNHLLVVWPTHYGNMDLASLVDISTGQIVLTSPIAPGLFNGSQTLERSVDGTTACLGEVFVDYGTQTPRIMQVDGFECQVIDGNTLYGPEQNTLSAMTVTDGSEAASQPFTDDSSVHPTLPAAVSGGLAYVVAQKVDAYYVYALPKLGGQQ